MDQGAIVTFRPSIGGRIIRFLTILWGLLIFTPIGLKLFLVTYNLNHIYIKMYTMTIQVGLFSYFILFLHLLIIFICISVLYCKIELNSEGISYTAPLERRFIPYSDIKNVYRTHVLRGPNFYIVISSTSKIEVDLVLFGADQVEIIERRLYEKCPVLKMIR